MEYLDLYDGNKQLTGEKIVRGMGNPQKGKYINVVIVFIENSEGEFLIQKTSNKKNGVWATTGGHVESGATADEAIIKEIKEELGLDVDLKEIVYLQTIKFDFVFMDVYFLKKDIDISDLTLQLEEVESVKWLRIEEIKSLIEKGLFRKSNIKAFNDILSNKND